MGGPPRLDPSASRAPAGLPRSLSTGLGGHQGNRGEALGDPHTLQGLVAPPFLEAVGCWAGCPPLHAAWSRRGSSRGRGGRVSIPSAPRCCHGGLFLRARLRSGRAGVSVASCGSVGYAEFLPLPERGPKSLGFGQLSVVSAKCRTHNSRVTDTPNLGRHPELYSAY